MKNLNFQAISEAAKKFQPPKDDSYLVSYPHFLAYFKALDEIQLPHLVIASHFVYGWMPTILNLKLSEKEEVLGLLNKVKNEDYALDGEDFKSKWPMANSRNSQTIQDYRYQTRPTCSLKNSELKVNIRIANRI